MYEDIVISNVFNLNKQFFFSFSSRVLSGPVLLLTILHSLMYELKLCGFCLKILAMLNSFLRFLCFTILFTYHLPSTYPAKVYSLSFLFFLHIGSLPPFNSLFDIIVDPRWMVDGEHDTSLNTVNTTHLLFMRCVVCLHH